MLCAWFQRFTDHHAREATIKSTELRSDLDTAGQRLKNVLKCVCISADTCATAPDEKGLLGAVRIAQSSHTNGCRLPGRRQAGGDEIGAEAHDIEANRGLANDKDVPFQSSRCRAQLVSSRGIDGKTPIGKDQTIGGDLSAVNVAAGTLAVAPVFPNR